MDCNYYREKICGSCTLLAQTSERTREMRKDVLRELLPDLTVHPVMSAPATGSRIRARVAVTAPTNGSGLGLGFRTERFGFVPVEQCPLHHAAINALLLKLRPLLENYRISAWVPETDRGELKHLIVTCDPTSERLMLQCVLRSRESVDRLRLLWQEHQHGILSDVDVFSVNLQDRRTSRLTGVQEVPISHTQRLSVTYGSATILYGPQSFIQTNHQIAERLYTTAADILHDQGSASLLDIYCGTGAFSLVAAAGRLQSQAETTSKDASAFRIEGFDVSEDAVGCANAAAENMHIVQARYRCQDAARFRGDATQQFDAVICNPPRRGLDGPVVALLSELQTPLVLYSSCNPVSLQRDLELLKPHYRFTDVYPFDMFPYTSHMEVLAVGHAIR